MNFKTLKDVKDYLENTPKKEIKTKEEQEQNLRKISKLFETSLFDVVSKFQSYRKDIILTADFYPDYNLHNDFGKEKKHYQDGGQTYSYLMDKDKMVDDLVIVYSIVGEEGKKIPIAFKKTKRGNYIFDKTMCLRAKYLQDIKMNMLFGENYHLVARRSPVNDHVLFTREKLFVSHPETEKIKGEKDIDFLYIAQAGDAHKAVINYPRLNRVMWEIVAENVDKLQARKAKEIVAEIKSRKMMLNYFCEDEKRLQEDIKIEEEIIKTDPQDKISRERLKTYFSDKLWETKEFKEQEKALISSLQKDAKVLQTKDAKNDLSLIIK